MSASTIRSSLISFEEDEVILELLKQDLTVTDPQLIDVLHLAVRRETTDVAEKLIDMKVDINSQDEDGWTPLHHAIDARRLNAVCMLLHYDVDITICADDVCPLLRAIDTGYLEIIEALMYYYFEEPVCAKVVFSLITSRYCPSLKPESNGNYRWNDLCLEHAFAECRPRQFINSLMSILESPVANELIMLNDTYIDTSIPPTFLSIVLAKLIADHATDDMRLSVLYSCLSVGFEATPADLTMVYLHYGYGEELNAIIYAGNLNWSVVEDLYKNLYALPAFVPIYDATAALTNLCLVIQKFRSEHVFLQLLERYCVPIPIKELVGCICHVTHHHKQSIQVLRRQSNVPALSQLCRDTIRSSVIGNRQFDPLYELSDAVKTLPIPTVLQDLLLLKVGVYNN